MIARTIYARRFEEAHRLIEEGTHDIHEQCSDGITPIYAACFRGQLELVRLLLDKGADVNDGELRRELTPLYAAAHGDFTRICLLLIKHGATVNEWHMSARDTPLYAACVNDSHSVACLLLEYGATPNAHRACTLALEVLRNKTQLRHLLPRELVAIAYAFLV